MELINKYIFAAYEEELQDLVEELEFFFKEDEGNASMFPELYNFYNELLKT